MTAEYGVTGPMLDHCPTMRFCPLGLEEIKKQPEGGNLILIAETGSGPDGSSLTAYYRRSQGCGTEKDDDQPV